MRSLMTWNGLCSAVQNRPPSRAVVMLLVMLAAVAFTSIEVAFASGTTVAAFVSAINGNTFVLDGKLTNIDAPKLGASSAENFSLFSLERCA